jgi:hypothetical protein
MQSQRTPWWVWAVIVCLSLVQPALHAWIAWFPPEGTVATGLHIPDSALFIYSMRMFSNGFYSPYATCESLHGAQHFGFYPMAYLWMYGALGWMADLVRANHFLVYGLANGAGLFALLFAVYRFLRQAVPKHAHLAFTLFSLSGGLGGVAFLVSLGLGWTALPGFEDHFRRFALYELIEGPNLSPISYAPRLYYTVSLACALGGLTAFIKGTSAGSWGRALSGGLLLAVGTFINMRAGAFTSGVALLYVLCQSQPALQQRIRGLVWFLAPALPAGAASLALLRTSPSTTANMLDVASHAMWLSPFVTAAFLHLLVVPGEALFQTRRQPRLVRVVAWCGMGYLAAFVLLFVAHQVYYGNILVARDGPVAVKISDWALLGAVAGATYAAIRPGRAKESDVPAWVLLWGLGFLALSVSAFGQGWFLRFGPQRLMVMLWLPFCILTASGIQRLRLRHPRYASALTASMLGCGVVTIIVASCWYQGPLGRTLRHEHFDYAHAMFMKQADAELIEQMGEGRVLAPHPGSDVVAMQRDNPVVGGVGSFNMSDQPFLLLKEGVQSFFSPDTTNDARRAFVAEWEVGQVFCPATWPVDPAVVESLRQAPWLKLVAEKDGAVLFKVVE